jgi:hypothetical protein
LQNDEAAGMIEKKHEETVRVVAKPSGQDAAKEFFEEDGDQLRKTPGSEQYFDQ